MEGEYLSLDTAKKIAEKDKEIERLNKDLEISIEICNNRQKEIVRLNNIINELEKELKQYKYVVEEIQKCLNEYFKSYHRVYEENQVEYDYLVGIENLIGQLKGADKE